MNFRVHRTKALIVSERAKLTKECGSGGRFGRCAINLLVIGHLLIVLDLPSVLCFLCWHGCLRLMLVL